MLTSKQSPRRVISVFVLAMLNVSIMASLRNLPLVAEFGLSALFFFFIVALFFLIPCAFISAELATGWSKEGGVYIWVREGLGDRWGFLAIWMQWVHNVAWYPVIMSFVAVTLAYLIDPALADNKFFVVSVILVGFWGMTLLNYLGIKTSGWFSSIGVILGTLLPGLLIIILGFSWVVGGNPIQTPLSWDALIPSFSNLGNLVFSGGFVPRLRRFGSFRFLRKRCPKPPKELSAGHHFRLGDHLYRFHARIACYRRRNSQTRDQPRRRPHGRFQQLLPILPSWMVSACDGVPVDHRGDCRGQFLDYRSRQRTSCHLYPWQSPSLLPKGKCAQRADPAPLFSGDPDVGHLAHLPLYASCQQQLLDLDRIERAKLPDHVHPDVHRGDQTPLFQAPRAACLSSPLRDERDVGILLDGYPFFLFCHRPMFCPSDHPQCGKDIDLCLSFSGRAFCHVRHSHDHPCLPQAALGDKNPQEVVRLSL